MRLTKLGAPVTFILEQRMKANKFVLSLALVATINSTVGCGLLLYPERQGQRGGPLDPTVVLLDGVGLFFFLVPGIIAFAVDFAQGTIYMGGGQGGKHRLSSDTPTNQPSLAGMTAIKVTGPMTKTNIEAAIARELGQKVDITADNVQVQAVNLLNAKPHAMATAPITTTTL